MPKDRIQILNDAMEHYVTKGYGSLPNPLTPQALASDTKFNDFQTKFERAYNYYSQSFADQFIGSHLNGIDFNHPVDMVTLPAGQRHVQTQVAWGAKGSYYSTSDFSEGAIGISDKARMFNPQYVAPWQKGERDAKIEALRASMLQAMGKPDAALPQLTSSTSTKEPIAPKSKRTYEAQEEIVALKSTAAKIVDNWSLPNQVPVECAGGGMQIYVSNKENEKMKQVDFGAQDTPEENKYLSLN
jgi:hypothetical protein